MDTLKVLFRIWLIVSLFTGLTSFTPIMVEIKMELLDKGWDRHFHNHNKRLKNDHYDFGKFRDTKTGQIYILMFMLPENFDAKLLKKGSQFSIGVGHAVAIDQIEKSLRLNVKNMDDLKKYPTNYMVQIESE